MDSKYLESLSILELKSGFTLEELKKKWLELSKKYHPDKHATADEILRKLAEEQYKKINEAYTYLKENYGKNQYQSSAESGANQQKKSRMETDPIFYLENCPILNEENIRIFLNRFPNERNNILLRLFLSLKNRNISEIRNLSPRIEEIEYNQSFEIIVNRLFPNFKNKKYSFFTNIKLLLNEKLRNDMLFYLKSVKERLEKNNKYSFWGLNRENQDLKLLSNEYYFLLDNKLDNFIRESDSYLEDIFQYKEKIKNVDTVVPKASNTKVVYAILIVLLVISGFYFFLKTNNKQENSIENTTSYSQPQQEKTKKIVVENNSVPSTNSINTNTTYSKPESKNKFGKVVNDKYVGGSLIKFIKNTNDMDEYEYLKEQFYQIFDTMYVTEDKITYYYLNDIIAHLASKADTDFPAKEELIVEGNKLYYFIGWPKDFGYNMYSWIKFEIFERKFKDGLALRTAHVSCAINGVEYKDWEAIKAIYK